MGWRDLLEKPDEHIVLPWLGGSTLRLGPRCWTLFGPNPPEHGWYRFAVASRAVRVLEPAEPAPETLPHKPLFGSLVGDHLVTPGAQQVFHPRSGRTHFAHRVCSACDEGSFPIERVHLLEPGLERFARVAAARLYEEGPLVFVTRLMPLGPEDAVQAALDDGLASLASIPGVPPSLDAAFQFERAQRQATERRREAARRRAEEAEAKEAEAARRAALAERLGTAEGRRAQAAFDFGAAARAALEVGGAEYLDHRPAYQRGETAVRFRFRGRRFECTCDAQLRIIEAGICLTSHDDGEKGDDRFTLESLPAVIREADDEGKLVVFRHVY